MRWQRILMVSSEVEPFAKTGGLGDVVGALPKALNKFDHVDCRVVMPLYSLISEKYRKMMKYLGYIYVDVNWRHQYCGIYTLKLNNVNYYFLDNEFYFKHNKIYDDLDLEKFSFLDIAAFELCLFLKFKPNIIHTHDWQTGPIAALLESKYKYLPFFAKSKVIYTIHNLQYQGKFAREHVSDMLPIEQSFYGNDSLVSFMKLGIIYSSKVTTVSPTYKNEILTKEYGEGLDQLLTNFSFKLEGILNGIDYSVYNAETDKNIPYNFSLENYKEIKEKDKKELLNSLGLDYQENRPLIGIVTRLASQKGIELILAVMEELLVNHDLNIILLGSGDKNYENSFNYFACKYPTKFRAVLKFDNALAHQIYAGSDMFLMPSVFEPCGLAQMICLRYATVPLVRSCGGLKDSIIPFNEYTNEGNGFSFNDYNVESFKNTLYYALSIYNRKDKWNIIIENGKKCDFSWNISAKKYLEVYKEVLKND